MEISTGTGIVIFSITYLVGIGLKVCAPFVFRQMEFRADKKEAQKQEEKHEERKRAITQRLTNNG